MRNQNQHSLVLPPESAVVAQPLPAAINPGPPIDLGDSNFAIAEKLLNDERQQPNWTVRNQANFAAEHGEIIEGAAEELDSEDDGGDSDGIEPKCSCNQCPENKQYEEVKEILRFAKLQRKLLGFVPDHILLLASNEKNLKDLDGAVCYLLGRVQFRPYDCTAISMLVHAGDEVVAKMQSDSGRGRFFTFSGMLKDMASRAPDCPVWVARYRSLSFAGLHLVSLDSVDHCLATLKSKKRLQPGVDSDTDSDSDEKKEISNRLALLRKLTKPAGAAKKTATKPKRDSERKRGTKKRQPESQAPIEQASSSSEAARQEQEIEQVWAIAYEADAVSNPTASRKASSSSKTDGAVGSVASEERPAAEATMPPKPFKNDKGYCFVLNDSQHQVHLGSSVCACQFGSIAASPSRCLHPDVCPPSHHRRPDPSSPFFCSSRLVPESTPYCHSHRRHHWDSAAFRIITN